MAYALTHNGALVQELYPGLSFTDENGTQHAGNVIELWTPEELAAIGVLPITEPGDPPPGQRVSALTLQMVAGVPTRVATYEDAVETTKAGLRAYAVSMRYTTEVSGMLFDGNPIPTDDRSKTLVSGAYQKALADPSHTKKWQVSNEPIAFVTLTNAQLIALGLAFDTFVQSTFDRLETVAAGIEDGTITTTEQIDQQFLMVNRVYVSS